MEQVMSFRMSTSTLRPNSGHALPFRERLAGALRRTGESAKRLARVADCTPKAAERWVNAENSVTVDTLIELCRQYDEVWEEFRDACGRANDATKAELLLKEITAKLNEVRFG
jgi:plasmid maintenance system antidote protein VapI